MAKPIIEETNETYEKLMGMLKDANVTITHPITVYTSNLDKDAWICCNYSGPGIKMAKSEINFEDFRNFDKCLMKHCPTWTYTDKKK